MCKDVIIKIRNDTSDRKYCVLDFEQQFNETIILCYSLDTGEIYKFSYSSCIVVLDNKKKKKEKVES